MRHDTVESWYTSPSTRFTGGPDRLYDSSAAAEPLPPKRPLGFAPVPEPAPEQDPQLWEGDQA